MRKIIEMLAYHVLIGAYLFLILVGFWLFYPYKVVQYKQTPLPISSHQVKSGDYIAIRHDFCKYMNISPTITLTVENGVIFNLGEGRGITRIGCYNRVTVVRIPVVMQIGEKARFHYELDYKVNPLRVITYDLYSEQFTVIK